MKIVLSDITTVELDEKTGSSKEIIFESSGELLFIRTKRGNEEPSCMILEKSEAVKFRNILTCLIDSDVIEVDE